MEWIDSHVHYSWPVSQKSLEEAYGMYINRLKTYRGLTPQEEEKAKVYLQSIAVNGIVEEQVDAMITTMYWRI